MFAGLRRRKRTFAAIMWAGAVFALLCGDSAASKAYAQGQWTASVPVWHPAVHCGEGGGISCAVQSFLIFWGSPTSGGLTCFYTYNTGGKISDAVCSGTVYPYTREGRAVHNCLSGVKTGTDSCEPPRDKRDPKDRCYAAGNPIIVTSGVKAESAVDFSTAGPSPLVFSRTYFSETGT
jgi:hypothetical protein